MGFNDAFAARLADVLATLEATALLGSSERRVRGLGGLLRYACLTVPCDEAFVAVELEHLGRMHVPGLATREEWRPASLELPPLGTPFAFLLAGGGGHLVELEPSDPLLRALGGVGGGAARQGAFVPIRLGAEVVGGLALLFDEHRPGGRELVAAEQLAEVAAGTLEAYRTERALLELFATVLPELCGAEGATGFVEGLERFVHRLRLAPDYRQRLALAEAVARVARRGDAESSLALRLLAEIERFAARGDEGSHGASGSEFVG
ncbi:MAG: hypothetical protein FJ096_08935 [Deltaproteobacteria bacterium]|nr:hypothetical protein [Deltaproteobacteria bacterium]